MLNFLGSPSGLIFIHFIISIVIGYVAKKYLDRPFLLWFAIGFLVPVLSLLILIIIGYDGVYCPKCLNKIKKNVKICPHCGFDIEKYHLINDLNEEKRVALHRDKIAAEEAKKAELENDKEKENKTLKN